MGMIMGPLKRKEADKAGRGACVHRHTEVKGPVGTIPLVRGGGRRNRQEGGKVCERGSACLRGGRNENSGGGRGYAAGGNSFSGGKVGLGEQDQFRRNLRGRRGGKKKCPLQ